jgi:hypothetical protein
MRNRLIALQRPSQGINDKLNPVSILVGPWLGLCPRGSRSRKHDPSILYSRQACLCLGGYWKCGRKAGREKRNNES